MVWVLQDSLEFIGTANQNLYGDSIQNICDRILENHPYGCKWHSKYLALKTSIQHWISTHLWLQQIINT